MIPPIDPKGGARLLEIAQFWAKGPKPPITDQAILATAWLDLRIQEARLESALDRYIAEHDRMTRGDREFVEGFAFDPTGNYECRCDLCNTARSALAAAAAEGEGQKHEDR